MARAGDARQPRIRERGDHRLGVGGRRQPVLLADDDEHGHVDRRQGRARIHAVANRLLRRDERRDRLLERELPGARDDGRVDVLGEHLRRELLPERLAPGLAEEPDGVVARQSLLGRVRRGPGARPAPCAGDPLRAPAARARRRGSRPSRSRRGRRPVDQSRARAAPTRRSRARRLAARQIRGDHLVAGLLDGGPRSPSHMRESSGKAWRRRTVGRGHGCDATRAWPFRLAPPARPPSPRRRWSATSQPLRDPRRSPRARARRKRRRRRPRRRRGPLRHRAHVHRPRRRRVRARLGRRAAARARRRRAGARSAPIPWSPSPTAARGR